MTIGSQARFKAIHSIINSAHSTRLINITEITMNHLGLNLIKPILCFHLLGMVITARYQTSINTAKGFNDHGIIKAHLWQR